MKLYAVGLSVEYLGEGIDVRSDTHLALIAAETDEVAYDLADRVAAYMKTDVGGGYVAAEAMQVAEVDGDLPDFVTVISGTDVPEGDTDADLDETTEVVDQETTECCVCSADLAHRSAGFVCDTCGRLMCNYHVDAEMRQTDVCPTCR